MLELTELTFGYGVGPPALRSVSFGVQAGEFKVLLGPNGAGKTTLFALVTRLLEAPRNAVRIAGRDLRGDSGAALARMGVVFQQPTLDLDLTVAQNLRYHAALHGLPRALTRERLAVELDRLGLADRAGEKIRRLNGGHRRRVEIARALLHRPSLLLLDEPTVGLDVRTRRGIVDHVHRLSREEGIAVLWATHLIDEVQPDDTVVVLHRGETRADGPVADVVRDAGAHDLAGAFDRLTATAA